MNIPSIDYVNQVAKHIDGLILTGGGPEPTLDRDQFEALLIQEMKRLGKPILGICRGMQVVNKVLGGSMLHHVTENHPNSIVHRQKDNYGLAFHTIEVDQESCLSRYFTSSQVEVNSIHTRCGQNRTGVTRSRPF